MSTTLRYLDNWYFKHDSEFRAKMTAHDDMPIFPTPGIRTESGDEQVAHHFDFKDTASTLFIREFSHIAKVEEFLGQQCFPIADLSSRTLPTTLLGDKIKSSQAICLDLLVETLASRKATASYLVLAVHTVADRVKTTVAQIKKRDLAVPPSAVSAAKTADELVLWDSVRRLSQKAGLLLSPKDFQLLTTLCWPACECKICL
jgi:hypothetical protein